jgi:hypothetical protein
MMHAERPWYWSVLEIDAHADERTIKRAYARQLKTTRPDDDPDAFQRLRAAYEHALDALRHQEPAPAPVEAPAPVVLEKVALAPPAPVVLQVQRADTLSADALAHAAWGDFMETHTLAPLASLAAAQADERLHGFDARDAFELLAARHAANDACPADLRAALVEHFDWAGRGGPVLRRDPELAATLLGRHAADIGWNSLVEQAASDPLLAYLAQDTVPKKLPRRWDANFVGNMRDTLLNIRWRHPDLLAHRMNHDVFHWWEAQVADKRYFRQTAGWSSLAGIGLCALMITATPLGDDGFGALFLLVACQLLAIAGGAWLALRPPEQFYARALELQVRWFGKPLADARYDLAWQVGWMPPFAFFSVALLLPNPPFLLGAIILLGMTVCAAMAVLACSLAITRARFCLAFVLSIAVVLFAGDIPAFATIPEWTVQCFGLTLFTVFLSHGTPLYRMLGWSEARLAQARVGWLAAGVGLAVAVSQDAFPMAQLPALMLLLLAGVLIARYDAGLRLAFIGLIGVRALAGALKQSHSDAHYGLAILALITAYFVIAHLFNQAND